MVRRNAALTNLKAGYLFPEIARRRRTFAASHPEANIISLGIGNTTEPLTPHIDQGLVEGAAGWEAPRGIAVTGTNRV